MPLSMNRRKITMLIVAVVGLIVLFALLRLATGSNRDSFTLEGIEYTCSGPIHGRYVYDRGGEAGTFGFYFEPSNQEDFQRYCRSYSDYPTFDDGSGGGFVEFRAVLDILQREDVHDVIARHAPVEAWVKALSHKYIDDKEYLHRILPAYNASQIDCLIVVHSPEGTRFFIEYGANHESHDDHQYLEVPAAEFLASLNRASDEDITNFWLGLR